MSSRSAVQARLPARFLPLRLLASVRGLRQAEALLRTSSVTDGDGGHLTHRAAIDAIKVCVNIYKSPAPFAVSHVKLGPAPEPPDTVLPAKTDQIHDCRRHSTWCAWGFLMEAHIFNALRGCLG
ncbi:hypothetical protein T492DRAFT_222742 [Pavlovales sp. CCMP2436]|nr:hypothetical protein T492DRAFT_222742 [Pavlovales sp. CCMP2436]